MSIDYRTCECGETFADCADGVVSAIVVWLGVVRNVQQ